ncbi:MAG TPA: alpha-L-arabinofuranosidase C-terminal domain-containing protein [Candidatus Aquilonibacter sp.]|nr:alpha-L-arabinofuranosidase C-terminal domain-containing protein [Candidatus Aquilonibacter sp.]
MSICVSRIFSRSKRAVVGLFLVICIPAALWSQAAGPVEIQIRADQTIAPVSPELYGLMTEEINHSYDGGLYAELIRNRNFKEDPNQPLYWDLVQEGGGTGSMTLDSSQPLNQAIPASLKLTITAAGKKGAVGVANEGFWGIPAKADTSYSATIYAKVSPDFAGPLTLAIVGENPATPVATATIPEIASAWQRYEVTLTTGASAVAGPNRFVISASHPGTIWLGMVSLFPPTYANRANGNRQDIMQLLADMKPAFLRFPGGNYLEGNTAQTRFDWKETIGDISGRPGHMDDAWKYWSSDGMGLLEFLEWCEDLHMQPVLAVYAGYSLHGDHFAPGPDLQPYVNDALDEIEYVTGDAGTRWGAERAKDGHPAPFALKYVEIGNEDEFDPHVGDYEGRFAQFFDAIRAKYPELKLIATAPVTTRAADLIDEHYYRRSADEMAAHANDYDTRRRTAQKVFVGEWATRVGGPTPNMDAGLADAAWLTGLERNSDLVVMVSYAPLFVNVNDGAFQWQPDLIGYDANSSYGSPTYYVQKMFAVNHGDTIIPISAHNVPSKEWQPFSPDRGSRGAPPIRQPMVEQIPMMFFDATRDSKTGTIYVKIVNRDERPEPLHFAIDGASSIEPGGQMIVLSAANPDDTNSISDPTKIVPVTSSVDGLSGDFTITVPAYSVTILEIRSQ